MNIKLSKLKEDRVRGITVAKIKLLFDNTELNEEYEKFWLLFKPILDRRWPKDHLDILEQYSCCIRSDKISIIILSNSNGNYNLGMYPDEPMYVTVNINSKIRQPITTKDFDLPIINESVECNALNSYLKIWRKREDEISKELASYEHLLGIKL